MRAWQVERRKRTRHLIELGGLVVKARVVDLTGDDRAIILGALLWMADKLKSNQGEQARALWAVKERTHSLWNGRQMRPPSRRKRRRIGHNRGRVARRFRISQHRPPSRGLATGKPPYSTRGPLRRSLSAIAVQGYESARGPGADRHAIDPICGGGGTLGRCTKRRLNPVPARSGNKR
jgi:hypothetical protein